MGSDVLGLVSSSWALDRVLVNWLPMWPAITCGNGGCVALESSLVTNKTVLETESEQGASRNREDAENEKNG